MRAGLDQSLGGVNLFRFWGLDKFIQSHEEPLLAGLLVGFKNGIHVRPLLQKLHHGLLAGIGLRQDGRGRLLNDLSTSNFRRSRRIVCVLDFAA